MMEALVIILWCLGVAFWCLLFVAGFIAIRKQHSTVVVLDPIETEALRLAREEIEELEWRMGTGEKPQHIIRAERREESIRKEREIAVRELDRIAQVNQWSREEADKAAAELEAYYEERYGDQPETTTSETVKEIYEMIRAEKQIQDSYSMAPLLLRGPEEPERIVAKNALGEVVYDYIYYPRPRKHPRPRTMSSGAK